MSRIGGERNHVTLYGSPDMGHGGDEIMAEVNTLVTEDQEGDPS